MSEFGYDHKVVLFPGAHRDRERGRKDPDEAAAERLQVVLDERSRDGWEFVQIYHSSSLVAPMIIFRRPADDLRSPERKELDRLIAKFDDVVDDTMDQIRRNGLGIDLFRAADNLAQRTDDAQLRADIRQLMDRVSAELFGFNPKPKDGGETP